LARFGRKEDSQREPDLATRAAAEESKKQRSQQLVQPAMNPCVKAQSMKSGGNDLAACRIRLNARRSQENLKRAQASIRKPGAAQYRTDRIRMKE
jgi:hypothetical protein